MTVRTSVTAVLAAAVAFAGMSAAARAATITFTHEGAGSGTLDGTPFGPAAFTITATGDTGARFTIEGGTAYAIAHTTATITIDGVGSYDFTGATRTFVANNFSLVGFSVHTGGGEGPDLFNGPNDSAFGTWDMLGSIGPIFGAGEGELLQWGTETVNTTGGQLVFANAAPDATFTAVVPAPVTLALLLPLPLLTTRKRS